MTDLPSTTIGLAWLVDNEDPLGAALHRHRAWPIGAQLPLEARFRAYREMTHGFGTGDLVEGAPSDHYKSNVRPNGSSTRRSCRRSHPIPHPALDRPVEEAASRPGGLDRVVFGVTAGIAIAFLVWGFVSTSSLATASGNALTWVMEDAGWLFVLTASAIVVFVIWLAVSRFGDIPLGHDDEEPEFRTVSWVAMMFSAGMGIGLMFYGVGEPISHFDDAAARHR